MDVRYSTEQHDLRDAARHVADRLGLHAVHKLAEIGNGLSRRT